jgi:predicted metal-dependent phosphoesterase TrpH
LAVKTLQLKIDLHVHSNYSYDSLITPEELVSYSRKRGLHGVAVTDHDRIDGALKLAKTLSMLIIPGMEITSSDGHIIGLNLQEAIPPKLSADETVDKIHEAGGIAIACHPSAFFKGSMAKKHVTKKFDAVEVMNASAFPFNHFARRNGQIASRLGIAQVAGSDAHYGPEIGYAYTLIDAELDVDKIIKAIKNGLCHPIGSAIPMATRLKKIFLVFREQRSR